ncbi:MAG: CPBP family intramembrane metalloprotease [Clostridia bacterium]|nr:CPBP family intramembrane metalloprotease [Clostridia bacterium]
MYSMEQPPVIFESPWQQEHRKLKKDGNFTGGLLLALLVAELLVSVGLMIFASLNGWNLSAEGYGLGNTAYMIVNMGVYILFLVVPTALITLFSRRRIDVFPARKIKKSLLVTCVVGGMALAVLSNMITGWFVTGMEFLGVPLPDFPETVEPTVVSLLLNILATAVLPAFVEEWIFRGFVFGSLRAHGDGVAVVLSSLLFGLFHGNWVQIPFAFMIGLVLAYLVVLTDSIWPSVLLHGVNNLMSVLLSFMGLYVSTETANVMTTTVFLIVSAIGVAALVPFLVHHKRALPPIGNGVSLFTPGQRFSKLLTAPAMLIAVIGMLLLSMAV